MVSNDNIPVLEDAYAAAERVAQDILALAPRCRPGATRRAGNIYAAIAMASGRPAREADRFGTRMRGLIASAVTRLEARRTGRPRLLLPAGRG